nr:MAG TPA: hypothetical protein [Caudoviricetes sp.]
MESMGIFSMSPFSQRYTVAGEHPSLSAIYSAEKPSCFLRARSLAPTVIKSPRHYTYHKSRKNAIEKIA